MEEKSAVNWLPETRAAILTFLKRRRSATIPQLAVQLSLSTEAVRQQLAQMIREGWISERCPETGDGNDKVRGRPANEYCLTTAGDDLFPKRYDDLAIALLDQMTSSPGQNELTAILLGLTNSLVDRLMPATNKRSLEETLDRLKAIYVEGDPFTTVERRDNGPVLVETNCPYLAVAMERPAICSTTVSALQRLTGREVIREERFQDNDHRCVFQIFEDRPLKRVPRFQWEKPRSRP